MNINLQNMKTVQGQLTSGKEIRKPSDDPFKVARAMQLQTDIDTNVQYNKNIVNASNWLDTTDSALGQAEEVLNKVHDKLIAAGNAAYSPEERQAIKAEINQRVGELAQTMNVNFDGKYIFGGTRGTEKPMDYGPAAVGGNNDLFYYDPSKTTDPKKLTIPTPADPANPTSLETTAENNAKNVFNQLGAGTKDNSALKVEISQGVMVKYNVSAGEIMNYTSTLPASTNAPTNVQDLLKSILNHLDGKASNGTPPPVDPDATSKLVGEDLQGVTDALNNILKVRAETGAMQNRMESAKTENEDQNFNMTDILSKTEDIDITEKTMQYATLQTTYMSSLQTSAKILQPSLLDYLR